MQGRDAAKLLDKVYTHVFSSLQVGRSRYGVICGDDGIILDDGTVSRLGEDDFYLTTTTGNIEFVEKWLKWWIAGTGWCAHVTNVTADLAAVNLAGPRARDVLNKLTQVDLSPAAFKYMQCAQDEVGGVAAILLRIGFVEPDVVTGRATSLGAFSGPRMPSGLSFCFPIAAVSGG